MKLDDLGRERDDLEKFLLAKFAGYGTEYAGSDRLVDIVDDNCGVLVEANIGAVFTAILFASTNDDRLDDLTLLDSAVGRGLFDGCTCRP